MHHLQNKGKKPSALRGFSRQEDIVWDIWHFSLCTVYIGCGLTARTVIEEEEATFSSYTRYNTTRATPTIGSNLGMPRAGDLGDLIYKKEVREQQYAPCHLDAGLCPPPPRIKHASKYLVLERCHVMLSIRKLESSHYDQTEGEFALVTNRAILSFPRQ